jgi:hypothetical protein
MNRLHTYTYYLLLFLTAVLAMLPVAQFLHPLKWDMIDQAYPWRYFIGECLQDGILPLWNPYQLLGSPIHADPQSSAWYPVTWFFGFLIGYDIYVISIDFLLHIFLAGMGMFYLAKKLGFKDETAFLMGVSYMLSGFFTGNAQHFMWIISGAWIPFILGAFLQLRKAPSLPAAIMLALAFFMIMTGRLPGFCISAPVPPGSHFYPFYRGRCKGRRNRQNYSGSPSCWRFQPFLPSFSGWLSSFPFITCPGQ